jgi:hypothetical protein
MPAPAVALAGAAIRNPRRTGRWLLVLLALLGIWIVFLIAAIGSIVGLQPFQDAYGPSRAALADIPADYLELYEQAGAQYGVDPWILAAIGKIETNHGRSTLPGIRFPTTNTHGCCAGPMQMCVIDGCPNVGSQHLTVARAQAGTWRAVGVDGNRDGQRDPWDPADAIPAAARLLVGAGAPADYSRAIFAYNHASWYVADVLAQADTYRDAAASGSTNAGSPADTATIRELLANDRLVLTAGQRADLRAGGIDPRMLATLAWMSERHTVVITSLRHDHYPGTNHEAGRAFDIGSVDGEICRGTRTGPCAQLVRELAAVIGPTRSTELIYCWDPDPADFGMFARADHCDHIHWGMDA